MNVYFGNDEFELPYAFIRMIGKKFLVLSEIQILCDQLYAKPGTQLFSIDIVLELYRTSEGNICFIRPKDDDEEDFLS